MLVLTVFLFASAVRLPAQIDPAKRELIQLGYNQPVQGRAPVSGYAFYYLNQPEFLHRTNLTLRLAVAPVYLDSELGIGAALGPNTDLGIGVAGGGFADSYAEVRRGQYERGESFTGHSGEMSVSVYHLFNPGRQIPLNGVLRGDLHYSAYERDRNTAPGFAVPDNRASLNLRSGLRWGGKEPLLFPSLAMEMSAWYEGQFRGMASNYGFGDDREVKRDSHLFWARGLLAYTLPECQHTFSVSLTLGTSVNADRFSAYRLGGFLPLSSEFPLSLPGYYYQEISARQFVLFAANYTLPLDRAKRWALNGTVATAGVDYVPGLEQPGRWNSGVGGGISYQSKSRAWQILFGYAYGLDALRDGGRGAHSVGFLLQLDLERAHAGLFDPGNNPLRSRFLQRLFRGS